MQAVRRHQFHICTPGCRYNVLAISDRRRERLLAENVHAHARGANRQVFVQSIGCCDINGVDFRLIKTLFEVVVSSDTLHIVFFR